MAWREFGRPLNWLLIPKPLLRQHVVRRPVVISDRGETANILWCRHWPEKLEYKEPDGLIYCHSLKKIFLEQNPKAPSSSLLSLHTLRLVARYVKPADVMDAGERNCMLFQCPEPEKSQAIFHSTKCHTQIITSKSPFHPFEQKCADWVYSGRQISSISNDLLYWM